MENIQQYNKEYIADFKLEDLVPYEKNPKKHPKKQIDLIVKNIKENSFINPVIIDEELDND